MVRLIVVDSGGRRAFQVSDGRLSVGSGSEAKLKLDAAGVAVLHADIEVRDGRATLQPRPGVAAPQLFGRAVGAALVLQHGVPVEIGSATLAVEYADAPATPVSESFAARSAGAQVEPGAERAGPAPLSRDAVLPIWAWIAIGIPLLCVAAWFAMNLMFGEKARQIGAAAADVAYRAASLSFEQGQYSEASEQLDRMQADVAPDSPLAARVARLRKDIAEQTARSAEQIRNASAGRQYFDSQLEGFAERYMKGEVASPQARVFMKRARHFREQWPTHPQLEWVAREEARVAAAIDLCAPQSFADLQFEVESLTWSEPRNFREALVVVRAFEAAAQGRDLEAARGLHGELERKRAEWFDQRIEAASLQTERKETGESIAILLSILRFAGDVSMEDDAAQRLLRLDDQGSWLAICRRNDPAEFESIAQNRVIAAFLAARKL